MYAIISELNTAASNEVKLLWQRLSKECGLEAIFQLPTPHMTWVVWEKLLTEQAVHLVSKIASQERTMSAHTTGLGIFTGTAPVLYLPVIKFPVLLSFHIKLWNILRTTTIKLKAVYSPHSWIPHITLALNDLSQEKLGCAINQMVFEKIRIDLSINSLSIVEFEKESAGETINRFQFQKPSQELGEIK